MAVLTGGDTMTCSQGFQNRFRKSSVEQKKKALIIKQKTRVLKHFSQLSIFLNVLLIASVLLSK